MEFPSISAMPSPPPTAPQRTRRRRPPSQAEQRRRKAWGVEQGNAVKQHWAQLKGRR